MIYLLPEFLLLEQQYEDITATLALLFPYGAFKLQDCQVISKINVCFLIKLFNGLVSAPLIFFFFSLSLLTNNLLNPVNTFVSFLRILGFQALLHTALLMAPLFISRCVLFEYLYLSHINMFLLIYFGI